MQYCGFKIDIDHSRDPPYELKNSEEVKDNSMDRLIRYLNENSELLAQRDKLSKIAIVDDQFVS